MTSGYQDPAAVSDFEKTNVAIEAMNVTKDRTLTVTSEIKQPQHMTIKAHRGTFKSALWARSPTENVNCVGDQPLGILNPLEALASLTISSDPKVNNQRNVGLRRLRSFQENRSVVVGHQLEPESAINPNEALRTEYTLGQQAVLHDTTRMLMRYLEAPSPEMFKSMNPGEQGQVVKRFLGVKSAGIYARSMNSENQAHFAADSVGNLDLAGNAGPAAFGLPPADTVFPSVPLTRMRDVWQQRTTRQTGPVIGATTTNPVGQQANNLSPEGKFRGFLEGRSWDTQVSGRLLPATESPIIPARTEGSATVLALDHPEVSEDDFLQLVNENHESVLAAHNCDSEDDDGPLNSFQYVLAEGVLEGSNEPDWSENNEDISLARENSDLKNLVQQLEQTAGCEEYTNIMNHIEVPEDPRDMPIYHTRHAAYHKNLARGPDDPPMFPAPEESQEPLAVPLSIAHIFQEMMQLIDRNEVLIRSFEQEFNAFVAAYSPNSYDISTHQHFAVAKKLIAHMTHLKKENEEMGKLIGCGVRGNMLADMYDVERCEMHQEILQLREQVYRAREDTIVGSTSSAPGELLETVKESQRLREDVCRLRVRNAQLEKQQELWDRDEVHAKLREEIDNLRLRNDDLQEQLGDMWEDIVEGRL